MIDKGGESRTNCKNRKKESDRLAGSVRLPFNHTHSAVRSSFSVQLNALNPIQLKMQSVNMIQSTVKYNQLI